MKFQVLKNYIFFRCLKDAVLGDQCEDNEHCTGDNTVCDGVCRCEDGYVIHPNEQRCMKGIKKLQIFS